MKLSHVCRYAGVVVAVDDSGRVFQSSDGICWEAVEGGSPSMREKTAAEFRGKQDMVTCRVQSQFPRPLMAGDIVMAPSVVEGTPLLFRVVETLYNRAGMIVCAGVSEVSVPGTPDDLTLLPMFRACNLRLFYDEA